jgi:putative DNA primase/helicase
MVNPGLTKATEAAEAVGGHVVAPWFVSVDTRPTDFNDLEQLRGTDEVRRQIMAVVRPGARAPDPEPASPEPEHDYPDPDPAGRYVGVDMETDEEDEIDADSTFRILGHDRELIYIYQAEKKMVTARRESDWSETALLTIAPLTWWEMHFRGDKGGINKKWAINWLLRTAYRRGFFDPSKLRGRGAWRDNGRFVFHFGHMLSVDGELTEVSRIKSSFVYEQGRNLPLPADEPLSRADGKRIIETCKMFSWTRPASAVLMAGFMALAPLCGALRWRPHCWITGGAGSGKSTVLDLVWWSMNEAVIYAQGNSTEAGIRQRLTTDALPVLFDETEQNNEREEMRIQSVLALIRQSSTESEARTLKGTQGGKAMDFNIRSMFCLSSIQVGMKHQADYERLAILALKSKREGENASESWKVLSTALRELRADPDLPARLMRRSLELLPTTVRNIEVFAEAAAKKFGSQREGDQYGALLAGAYSLVSNGIITLPEAERRIAEYDWSEYLENSETEESIKALSTLLGKKLRLPRGTEANVYELIAAAAQRPEATAEVSEKEADAILRRNGMMIEFVGVELHNTFLLVAPSNTELSAMMRDTPYASDLKGQLLRVPGAFRREKPMRFAGALARCIAIPLTNILSGEVGPLFPGDIPADHDIPF